ncbi:hypothetical protein EVAR_82802_1 [Eumeta japonica]|uniref:Uncharacterized protein n=1 Tax=Eumeta variegata TaxID=151549 RepID=A0A4C1UMT1_EUMVA|nr:hypothetical protein EVAR_82802_1 [Eumeta japonica]
MRRYAAKDRAEILEKRLEEQFTPHPASDSHAATLHQKEVERRVREILLTPVPPLPGDYYVSPAETAKTILRLPKRKAPGPDVTAPPRPGAWVQPPYRKTEMKVWKKTRLCAARLSPAHSAPAAVGDTAAAAQDHPPCDTSITQNTDEIGSQYKPSRFPENDADVYQDAHAGHVCPAAEAIVEPVAHKQSKVGRFKSRIAPGHNKSCSSAHKSNKDSVKDKHQCPGNAQPHGHHHSKNVNHHQCCGAFGNPHARHKYGGNNCRLI